MAEVEFEKIYQEYFKPVYAYVYSLCQDHNLAEEITQETFFKALKSIDRFDGKCQVRVWLCQIGKNTYFTHCRKQKMIPLEGQSEQVAEGDFTTEIEDRETVTEVNRYLKDLGEPYYSVFFERIYHELSFERIAAIFGRSESWARVTFYRAKQKLIERMRLRR